MYMMLDEQHKSDLQDNLQQMLLMCMTGRQGTEAFHKGYQALGFKNNDTIGDVQPAKRNIFVKVLDSETLVLEYISYHHHINGVFEVE